MYSVKDWETLAGKFLEKMAENADFWDRVMMDVTNRTDFAGDTSCASHDVLDANEVMAEAFLAVIGREPDAGCAEDASLWSGAWDLARDRGFSSVAVTKSEIKRMALHLACRWICGNHSTRQAVLARYRRMQLLAALAECRQHRAAVNHFGGRRQAAPSQAERCLLSRTSRTNRH